MPSAKMVAQKPGGKFQPAVILADMRSLAGCGPRSVHFARMPRGFLRIGRRARQSPNARYVNRPERSMVDLREPWTHDNHVTESVKQELIEAGN